MQDNQPNFQSFREYFEHLEPLQQAGFFLWPSVLTNELNAEEKELFLKTKPSGVVLFKRNLSAKEQAQKLISELSMYSKRQNELFFQQFIIAVDEEGGRVSRLPLGVKTKPVFEFVKTHDKDGLKKQVLLQIQLAKGIGVNCILAPVLDIFTEPHNTVIGDRSFGQTPDDVCEYAEIVFNALEEHQIFSCGKHFPGHGNTKTDSHIDCAISEVGQEMMEQREWRPFQYFIQKNIPFIMAAHVVTPKISHEHEHHLIPATLNKHVLTNILRGQLGFKGLILSDDLRMGAIQKYYSSKGIEEDYLSYACIEALYAGCDILLSCHSIIEENMIFESIAQEMKTNKTFFDLCCEKAYRQFTLLSSHFVKKI